MLKNILIDSLFLFSPFYFITDHGCFFVIFIFNRIFNISCNSARFTFFSSSVKGLFFNRDIFGSGGFLRRTANRGFFLKVKNNTCFSYDFFGGVDRAFKSQCKCNGIRGPGVNFNDPFAVITGQLRRKYAFFKFVYGNFKKIHGKCTGQNSGKGHG